ncbi:uncharacterized protein BDV14DRAFT_65091 [Aspergillus stella-maris]|uniref:uncharacterized protein n=1 Tax=Aspergillus stella-maris TaxID=1810926 RepID=UPI003CCDBA31
MATYYDTTINTFYAPIHQPSVQPTDENTAPCSSLSPFNPEPPSYKPESNSSVYKPPFKPIIIPQITQSYESQIVTPFLRAYAPSLSTLSPPISATEFLFFIDSLNEVFIANPILQATGIAGEVMGYIPMLEIPGVALETVSEVGSEAGSWFRTRAYLKKMNESLFKSRGVKAKICGVKDIARYIGIHGVEGLKAMMEAYPASFEIEYQNNRHRLSPGFLLLDALWDRAAELQTTDLPIVPGDSNRLKRWNAMYAAREGRKQHEKLDKKHCKAREKQDRKYQEAIKAGDEKDKEIAKIERKIEDLKTGPGDESGKERSEKEVQKKIDALTTELEKARRKKDERVREKMESADGSFRELRRKDIKKALKMEYLVILPLDEEDRNSE